MPAPAPHPPHLPHPLADLNAAAERIWQDVASLYPDISLDVLPEVDSTNATLMARGRRGETSPCLLVAQSQQAGRGRQGRAWQASAGDSLTFSWALPLFLDQVPGGGGALSLAVGLAVAQALDAGLRGTDPAEEQPPVALKWPNDLWCDDRKLGGILIEVSNVPGLASPLQRWVVIGVGLNVRRNDALPVSATCLQDHCALPLSVGQVWGWVAPALIQGVQSFERTGFTPLEHAFAQRDALKGRDVALWTAPGSGNDWSSTPPNQTGRALGVDRNGALLVHTDTGVRAWTTGDVSVRLTQA